MPTLDTVLFDLGGVLTPDPWQSILLTPGTGLVDTIGLDRSAADAAAESLWLEFSQAPRAEAEYWSRLGAAMSRELPADKVRESEAATLRANEQTAAALALLESRAVAWGLISDNTSFWYHKQLELLGIADRVDAELEFVSFRYGLSKSVTSPTLFEVAAKTLGPARTLVVDDRETNLAAARSAGFQAECYSMGADRTGSGLLELLGRRLTGR